MPARLVILGAGGHGKVVADAALAARQWQEVLATDRDPERCQGALLPGVRLLPLDDALALPDTVFHVAIGAAAARERETALLRQRALATVVHPAATVSPYAQLGPGSFVAAQAVLAPGVRIGRGVIVNHGAVIDHDAEVGGFSHVAPRAALGGGSWVGARVLVGAGAVVLPTLTVGDDVVIGAGAVVRVAIAGPGSYAGVPARRLR